MDVETLKAVQAPIKEAYRHTPQQAVVTLKASGVLGSDMTSPPSGLPTRGVCDSVWRRILPK